MFTEVQFTEPGFDDWAMALRHACEDQAMAAGLAYLSQSSGTDLDDGIRVARRLLQIDPTSEPAHQALIRLHLAAAQPGPALKQFEACREVLKAELGITPSPETERLIGSIHSPAPVLAAAVARDIQPSASGLTREISSIVVLPLDGPPDDVELGYIGSGIVDDITTELTRYRALFVISRDSTIAYRAGREDISAACQRLGVRHALMGSLRRAAGKYRVNLRLVDGATGQNLWSERYDLDREDFMDLPDEIINTLVSNIATWLDDDALARARRKPVSEWRAYEHFLQGQIYHQRSWYNVRNIFRAIGHFERAIEIEPGCARAYAYLACARASPYVKSRELADLDPCMDLAQRAIELDPLEAEGHRMAGGISLLRSHHDLSREHFTQAENLHPGHAHILAHHAKLFALTGEHETARNYLNRARQLNPLHPAWYWEHMAVTSFAAKDYRGVLSELSRMQVHSFYDRLYAAAAA
ncbi:MAG: BTAD domain-containing putative transcriptional regulator, partial [Alphaproteobacteria bacterium]